MKLMNESPDFTTRTCTPTPSFVLGSGSAFVYSLEAPIDENVKKSESWAFPATFAFLLDAKFKKSAPGRC